MSCFELVTRYHSLTLRDNVRKSSALGPLGEALACQALRDAGFRGVRVDRREQPKYGALLGLRGRTSYVIEVVARKKLKRNGQLNRRYRFSFKNREVLHQEADRAEENCEAKAAWLAVRLDSEMSFSAFFGTFISLGGKAGIPMATDELARYELLATEGDISETLARAMAKAKDVTAFVSYAREQEGVARGLVTGLKKDVQDIWFAPDEVRAGDDLPQLIQEKLKLSRFGIPLLTPSYFTSRWSQEELETMLALRREAQIRLLPISQGLPIEDAQRELARRAPDLGEIVILNLDELAEETVVASLLRAMKDDGRR